MKRRDFIAGGCAVPLVAGAAPLALAAETVKDDKYWEDQWLINELEEENAELRAHAMIMSKRG